MTEMIESETVNAEQIAIAEFKEAARAVSAAESTVAAARQRYMEAIKKLSELAVAQP